jgi:hypothetical protein
MFVIAVCMIMPLSTAMAQSGEKGEALRIERQEDLSETMESGATVAVLYSSQACAFCPEADRFFARLVEKTDIIGLACHIDYFDVTKGALSKTFCTRRQQRQVAEIPGAFVYTPQIIINGRYDVLGHKIQRVADQLIAAAKRNTVTRLDIAAQEGEKGVYNFALPARELSGQGTLWLAVYDAPHDIDIAEGANKGEHLQYVHIVSVLEKLGTWDGRAKTVTTDLAPRDTHAGFVVLAEDAKGRIVAAGEHDFQ